MRSRTAAFAMSLALITAACSSSTPAPSAAEPTDAPVPTAAPTVAAASDIEAATETPTATPEPPANAEPLLEGAQLVTLTSPTEGEGLRPQLTWEPVEGAAEYMLVVLDGDGAPYWAWSGSATSVPLGGGELPEDHGSGPIVEDGASWSVTAYDADGGFLAISDQHLIAP